MRKIISIATFALFVTGCEKVIEPKSLPEQDPRLVMNCIVNGNEPVSLTLSSSRSIVSGKSYVMIDNGKCDLFEDGRLVETLTSAGGGVYHSAHVAQSGRRYRIEANAQGFEPVSAEAVMPDSVAITNLRRKDTANYFLSISENPGFYRNLGGELRYSLNFRDDRSSKNFYQIRVFVVVTDTSGNQLEVYPDCGITHLNALSENQRYFGSTMEFTDESLVEENVNMELSVNVYSSLSTQHGRVKVGVYLVLGHLGEEYYKYARSVRDQAGNAGNPFSEPVQVYSNTSSKMGILACIGQGNIRELFFGEPKSW